MRRLTLFLVALSLLAIRPIWAEEVRELTVGQSTVMSDAVSRSLEKIVTVTGYGCLEADDVARGDINNFVTIDSSCYPDEDQKIDAEDLAFDQTGLIEMETRKGTYSINFADMAGVTDSEGDGRSNETYVKIVCAQTDCIEFESRDGSEQSQATQLYLYFMEGRLTGSLKIPMANVSLFSELFLFFDGRYDQAHMKNVFGD